MRPLGALDQGMASQSNAFVARGRVEEAYCDWSICRTVYVMREELNDCGSLGVFGKGNGEQGVTSQIVTLPLQL